MFSWYINFTELVSILELQLKGVLFGTLSLRTMDEIVHFHHKTSLVGFRQYAKVQLFIYFQSILLGFINVQAFNSF
jgi:hypothetical protein